MKKFNKIAVIGGTGKSGSYLVKELLNQEYQVKLLLRNPEKSPPKNKNLELVVGDVSKPSSIKELITGSDALISTLGIGIPESPRNIFSKTTQLIIQELRRSNLKRYILLSSLNVDTEQDQKSEFAKAATAFMYSKFPVSTKDKQEEFNLLNNSGLDWTMVRSSMIELTDSKSDYAVSTIDCLGQKISAASLAAFLVKQLESEEFIRKAPFIWDK
ncbi:NAD(P)-dependent oxidoreductase [Algoriphagus machipongonensis]|uniref:NAD(P)-binding domain-containing protein n=1 Tax=Algoriphagus machipongonensis TaxID=388413 RepID=A3HXM0_9BACT|nr:NAD(P)H-binding protein [Algoriphagus machipongonensis]EAZ81343.1 hypothetical protein ALPR1_19943 [Algoriphagus machipongonensis]